MTSPRKEQSRRYYLKHRTEILKRVEKYRNKNRLKLRARDRKKYAINEKFRKKCTAYQKVYRKENPDKVRDMQRKYRQKHEERLREYHNNWKRKWGKTPKGKLASSLKGYRRRALLKDIGTHTDKEWKIIVEKHKGRCAICKKKKKLTKDHIKPLSKGGTNTIDNIQPLCQPCNAKKGNRGS